MSGKRRSAVRLVAIVSVACLAWVAPRVGGASGGGTHAAYGGALVGERVLRIDLAYAGDHVLGAASLYSAVEVAPVVVDIRLDCAEVAWLERPFSTPYHALFAAGVGSDGNLYYLTVIDQSVGSSSSDLVSLETEPGPRPCGAPEWGDPILAGEFAVAP